MGLVVNRVKTNNLLSSKEPKTHSWLVSHVTVDMQNFEVVHNFAYPKTSIKTKDNISLQVERGIILLTNSCYLVLTSTIEENVENVKMKS